MGIYENGLHRTAKLSKYSNFCVLHIQMQAFQNAGCLFFFFSCLLTFTSLDFSSKRCSRKQLRSWMHKSIPSLKDLAPSSENINDSYTQLCPLHRLRTAWTKQHLIACYSEIQIVVFLPAGRAVTAACGQHLLAVASFLRRHTGNGTGNWRTGADRAAQPHLKTPSPFLGSLVGAAPGAARRTGGWIPRGWWSYSNAPWGSGEKRHILNVQ